MRDNLTRVGGWIQFPAEIDYIPPKGGLHACLRGITCRRRADYMPSCAGLHTRRCREDMPACAGLRAAEGRITCLLAQDYIPPKGGLHTCLRGITYRRRADYMPACAGLHTRQCRKDMPACAGLHAAEGRINQRLVPSLSGRAARGPCRRRRSGHRHGWRRRSRHGHRAWRRQLRVPSRPRRYPH